MSNIFRPKIEDPRPPACSISVTQFVPTEKRNPSEGGGPTIKTNSNEIFHPTKLKKRKEREERGRNNQKTAQRTADKQIARDPEHRTPDSGGGWRESREALFMVQQISG